MDSLCHPWFTTANLSYRFPIFETCATALCGTTGTTCRWHGSCRTYPTNANFHVICKVKKTEKCISPVSSVKCLGKTSHDMGPLQLFGFQKDAKHVMSTNSHTVHFTSHMNKDSIWVYDYLLAVRIIQNYTSTAKIFQSHMSPFTSLFHLATILQLFRSYLAAL